MLMSNTVHSTTEKDEKLRTISKVLLNAPEFDVLRLNLERNGLGHKKILRFLIETCLLIYRETIKYEHNGHEKVREKAIKVEKKDLTQGKIYGPVPDVIINDTPMPEEYYNITPAQCLTAIRYLLLTGHFDPKGVGTGGYRAVRKIVGTTVFMVVGKVLLAMIFPPLGIVLGVYRIAFKPLIGSHLPLVMNSCATILLQRLLLAVQGINIDEYYQAPPKNQQQNRL